MDRIPGYAAAADLDRTGPIVADAEIDRAVSGSRTVIAIDRTEGVRQELNGLQDRRR